MVKRSRTNSATAKSDRRSTICSFRDSPVALVLPSGIVLRSVAAPVARSSAALLAAACSDLVAEEAGCITSWSAPELEKDARLAQPSERQAS